MTNERPPRNDDLHGSVSDRAPVALLLLDVINTLEFPGNKEIIARRADGAADRGPEGTPQRWESPVLAVYSIRDQIPALSRSNC